MITGERRRTARATPTPTWRFNEAPDDHGGEDWRFRSPGGSRRCFNEAPMITGERDVSPYPNVMESPLLQ